jgi:hypothetical protein
MTVFWVHQLLFGSASAYFGLKLLTEGQVQGIISVIGIFLFWIGGTLTLGLSAIFCRLKPLY